MPIRALAASPGDVRPRPRRYFSRTGFWNGPGPTLGFGGGLEGTAPGRLQLAAAVLAGRAGATKVAETFLDRRHRKSSTEARAIEISVGHTDVVGLVAVIVIICFKPVLVVSDTPREISGR